MKDYQKIYEELETSSRVFDVSAGVARSLFELDCEPVSAAPVERRGADGAGAPSMPVTNRHSVKYLGGFDGGLEIGFFGVYSRGCGVLFSMLEAARGAEWEPEQYIKLGGAVLRVSPSGAKVGGLHYKYHLLWHGLDLYFHTKIDSDNIAPFRVKFGAVPLMKFDVRYLYNQVRALLSYIGFEVQRETVSRVDFQIMIPGVTPFDFFAAMRTGSVVTLSRGKYALYGNVQTFDIESLTIKSRYVELCIYDKLQELKNKDFVYSSAFAQRFGTGYKKLCRVEIRCRGDFLRRFNIRSFEDVVKRSAPLLAFVVSDWFRILEKEKVRGHENTAAVSPLWARVQSAFKEVFEVFTDCRALHRRRPVQAEPVAAARVKSALGYLASAAAALAGDAARVVERSEFLKLCGGLLDKFCNDVVLDRLAFKIDRLAVSGYYD